MSHNDNHELKGKDVNKEKVPDCCKTKGNSVGSGILYGLIPHIGCIGFIIASIFGVTVLMQFFKPLLMNRYFFHALVGLSVLLATVSAAFYLKKHNRLSKEGIKKEWKYLSTMYGLTIGINLVLFLLIFPLLANFSSASLSTGEKSLNSANADDVLSSLKISVSIPCSGHAPLITNEIKSLPGIMDVQFSFPNIFMIKYNPDLVSKEQILALDVFQSYPAKVLEEGFSGAKLSSSSSPSNSVKPGGSFGGTGSSGCGGCGGTGGCGGCGGTNGVSAGTCGLVQ